MGNKGKCFVIMGYGVKTDYSTGRNLDLDKTYKNIIKPAAEKAGLECIRADEIKHSGTIDVPMYKHLITADVVIADLSTYNPNAFYELGVRHALRPRTTIAIAENELKPPFDVNHTVIRSYEHLGKDIGYDEVKRFREELVDTIETILNSEDVDSPVYTHINNLMPPILSDVNDTSLLKHEDTEEKTLSTIIDSARCALEQDDFVSAKSLFRYGNTLDSNNEYIIQKLALSTYKSKLPNHIEALHEALAILSPLNLDTSTDPETLGLVGAIHKRLWEETQETGYLSKSIYFYEKGFYIKNDYYNGINLAFLLNIRGDIQEDNNEAVADYIIANRIRFQVINICNKLYQSDNFKDRSDQYWVIASLEEAYFGLNNKEKYTEMKELAELLSTQNWERSTTEEQILKINTLLERSPLKA
ncbi:TRAFs-binding domain-containing protein [Bacillus pseudomycoides]|uniref:TRAFs-binding domain-containing protein n=1 Tax=Bacillus pseudomycoides TaxID=64104 RepID=UPI00031FCFF1|nr:TRAFs-binding domain-containing protein [Bacillus pseudomycoides]